MSDRMTELSAMAVVIGDQRRETVKAWQRAARLAQCIAEAVAKYEMPAVVELVNEFRIANGAVHPHTARLVDLLAKERQLHREVIDFVAKRLPEEDRGEGEA